MKEFIDSFGSAPGQESQQFSITIEEPAQYFGDSEDPLTVRDIIEYIIFNPGSPKEGSFLGARRAEESCFTREGDKEVLAALRTADSSEAMFENSTIKIFINGFRDDFTQETELFFIFIRIDIFVFLEMVINYFIESGFFRSSSFIYFAVHHGSDGQ